MKRKIEIVCETGIDPNGLPVRKTIKTFKNEPEARAFYNDRRNIRRYGTMFMLTTDEGGGQLTWDDRRESWVTA